MAITVNPQMINEAYGKTVNNDILAKLQEFAADGIFDDNELAQAEELGVDTVALTQNTQAANTAKNTQTTAVNTAKGDISAKVDELKQKYSAEAGGSDPYTMSNPQLKAFKQAIDDGLIADLSGEGFSKNDIVNIIAEVFPSIGISLNEDGSYNCPIGHDAEAKELFAQFSGQLAVETSPEVRALREELNALNSQIEENNQQIDILKPLIEKLQKEIEDEINAAIEKSEDIAEEQKEAASKLVSEELEAYTKAEGEISYEDFQSNLNSKLSNLTSDASGRISAVVNNLMSAEGKMLTLNGYMTKMGSLIQENKSLQGQIDLKNDAIEQLTSELSSEGAEDPDCKKCDPIGFTAGSERYDFFIDKDADGKLSNEKEFLGAENGWAEMEALDADGNGKVEKDEMEDLMVVVTSADGTQTTKKASEVFGDTDSIDLNSYKSLNKDMANGNTLLGTFGLTFQGEEIADGYNTLDRIDWLEANYDFSDKDNGRGRFAQDVVIEAENKDFDETYAQYQEKYAQLEEQLEIAWKTINIDRESVKEAAQHIANQEGLAKADEIEANFAKIAKAEEEPEEKEPVEEATEELIVKAEVEPAAAEEQFYQREEVYAA